MHRDSQESILSLVFNSRWRSRLLFNPQLNVHEKELLSVRLSNVSGSMYLHLNFYDPRWM